MPRSRPSPAIPAHPCSLVPLHPFQGREPSADPGPTRCASHRIAATAIAVLCLATAPAGAGTSYELDIIAPQEQLIAGGVQEFPVVLREMIFPGPGGQGFFGRFPVKSLGALIEDPTRNATPLNFIPVSGFSAEVEPLNPADASGFTFLLTADPPIFDSAVQTPISGFSEWRIGTLRIALGPPILLDDGDGGIPDGVRLLDLAFRQGGAVVRPTNDPSSGSRAEFVSNSRRFDGTFEQDDSEVTTADGEQVVIDEPLTNIGIFRAENGGELVLAADFVNFGTTEALAGSAVTNEGVRIRQLEGGETAFTFDDRLTGGVFRAVNGALNVAPPGFVLGEIERGILHLSGPEAVTNLFDDAASSPGDFSLDGRSLQLRDGGTLRLEDGVHLDAFDIAFFGGGRLELFDRAAVTTFIGVAGASGVVAGDGTITSTHEGVSVGRVEIGRSPTQPGTLEVVGNASFQVQSRLHVDIASATAFDKLAVTGRLFIEVGEKDGAGLLIDVADDYIPPVGTQFAIATAAEIAGNFEIVCDSSPHVDFVPTVADGTLVLEAVADQAGQFRALHGLAPDGSDDYQDSSGNGIPDIYYYLYALGDPANPAVDPTRLPTLARLRATGELQFSYLRPVRPGCFCFQVRTSTDLESWVFPGSLGLGYLPSSETVEAVGATHQRVTQTYLIQPDEAQRYYALDVTELSIR